MDKYTKSVYKFLLSQPGYGFATDFYTPEGFNTYEFRSACEYLARLGYAKKIDGGYALLHEGIRKREIEIRAFFRSFFTKFLVGIIVGALAGALAEYLSHFLQSLFSR